MSGTRRRFTAELKAQIVRRHLGGKEAVSALAEEFELQPSQIHQWVNLVLAQAEKAFEKAEGAGRGARNEQERLVAKVEHLEAKLVNKNEVIAELLEENVKAKKAIGGL